MKRPRNEELYEEALLSEAWDTAQSVPTSLRYVVFSLQRTGSEYLCARLRRQGIGVPCEYFNEFSMPQMAARLGCIDDSGQLNLDRYLDQLERKRTTSNGIFGTKLQPLQLASLTGRDLGKSESLLRRFDRVVALRRRDKVLQAISLLRAKMTWQWHLLPGDEPRRISFADEDLFPLIDQALAGIARGEERVKRVTASLDPLKVRSIFCEDLAQEELTESTIRWLSGAQSAEAPAPNSPRDHALPLKGDAGEALEIKDRYLAWTRAVRRT